MDHLARSQIQQSSPRLSSTVTVNFATSWRIADIFPMTICQFICVIENSPAKAPRPWVTANLQHIPTRTSLAKKGNRYIIVAILNRSRWLPGLFFDARQPHEFLHDEVTTNRKSSKFSPLFSPFENVVAAFCDCRKNSPDNPAASIGPGEKKLQTEEKKNFFHVS